MQIIIAKTAGYCMGVKKAMNSVLDIRRQVDDEYLFTFGPLIHNNETLKLLDKRNIKYSENIDEIKEKKVVVRAHGVKPEILKELKQKSNKVYNCTCPDVAKIQGTVRKYSKKGYHIIIFGNPGHPEVIGLTGYAENNDFTVVKGLQDINLIPEKNKYCIVSQSTQFTDKFYKIIDEIKKGFKDKEIIVKNTICASTEQRQKEVKQLAKDCDIVIVIGGRNSSNTLRLSEISKSINPQTIHIENENEIDIEQIKGKEKIGITAGASTPSWLIYSVIHKLKKLDRRNTNKIYSYLIDCMNFLIESNIILALAAGLLTLSNCLFIDLPIDKNYFFVSFFYILAMHILGKLIEKESVGLKFFSFYQNKIARIFLWIMCILSSFFSIYYSLKINFFSFMIISLGLLAGAMYIIPALYLRSNIKIHFLKKLPASKEVYIPFAWAVITVLIPYFSNIKMFDLNKYIDILILFLSVFALILIRTAILNLSDMYENLLVGKETIATILGKKNTILLLNFLILFFFSMLIILSVFNIITVKGFIYSLGFLYLGFTVYFFLKQDTIIKIKRDNISQFILDASLYLISILSFI